MNLNDILLNLKIISDIKEYDKISITDDNKIIIDSPYIGQCVIRRYNGDNREKSIEFIEMLIDNIFKIMDNLIEDQQNVVKNKGDYTSIHIESNLLSQFHDILIQLQNTIDGLQNLKITYVKDVSIKSKLDLIITKIYNRINKIKNIMKLDTN